MKRTLSTQERLILLLHYNHHHQQQQQQHSSFMELQQQISELSTQWIFLACSFSFCFSFSLFSSRCFLTFNFFITGSYELYVFFRLSLSQLTYFAILKNNFPHTSTRRPTCLISLTAVPFKTVSVRFACLLIQTGKIISDKQYRSN